MSDEKPRSQNSRRGISKVNSFMSGPSNNSGLKKKESVSKAPETHRSTLNKPIITKRKTDTSVDVVKDSIDRLKITDIKMKKPVMSKRSSDSAVDQS